MTTKKKVIKASKPIEKIVASLKETQQSYIARRPHRSFRWTRRRDYARSLKLPSYFSFNNFVLKTLWSNKKTFLLMAAVYSILSAVLVGTSSQDTYNSLSEQLRQSGTDIFSGNFGELGKAGLLMISALNGNISNGLTDVQQTYAVLIILMAWLTTVWLLRNMLAGHMVKLRDGLYNATAPILSTFLVVIVLVIQLLPIALALLGYSAAVSSGLISGGVEAMLFWIAELMLVVLSLYFVTSTFIALVVVTLPGMYPFQALKTAGDLVIGRRVRILMRILWLLLSICVAWVVVMIPVILIDGWVKTVWPATAWVPTIPVLLLILSSLTIIWSASYIYLLYRRIVADDSAPA